MVMINTSQTEAQATADALELRVLHGPQAGSTLPLELGETYTLGTADTCAVLLAGTQIEAEHVALSADSDGIQVTLLQGKVMTIDRGEVSSGQVLSLGTVLRLGRVKLTVDSVDAPWPHDDALEEPDPVPVAQVDVAAVESSRPAGALPEAATPSARSNGSRNWIPSVVLGGAATLLMGAAVAAWVTSDEGHKAVADAPALQAAALAPAGAAVSALSSASTPASAPASAPQVRAATDSDRLKTVTQFLDKHRVAGEVEVNVEKLPSGTLRIIGAAATRDKLEALTDAARTELADAAPVEFAMLLRSELAARFEDRLRASGLAGKFKVQRRDPQLELQAVLGAADLRIWEKLFLDFTHEYGNVLTIVAHVQHERDTVQAQIETVVGGSFPYLVTIAGKRIAPGGTLDGRTLVAIRDGEAVFSDGLRVRYGN